VSTSTIALLYSAEALKSSMGLLSLEAASPALEKRVSEGFSPVRICSADVALMGVGATEPSTIRAS